MLKYILPLVVLLSLCFMGAATASDEVGGVIDGRIINGTQNGSSVGKLEVTLHSYQGETEIDTATVVTDSDGNFRFENLSVMPENKYQIRVVFQEAEYSSDYLTVVGEEAVIPVDITVYDAVKSDEAIKIGMAHTIVYVEDGSLQIKDYFVFINETDKAYIGSDEASVDGERKTLVFSLPEGAHNLQPTVGLMECCIITDENGFYYSMPILPGYTDVAYSYTVHYDSDEYPLSYAVNYPMVRYDLLLQGVDIKLKDTSLVEEEPMNINGVTFSHFSGGDYLPGDLISARLSVLGDTGNTNPVIWIVLGAFVIGIGLAVYYLGRKGERRAVSESSNERQALLLELAGLDDDFTEGKIPEDKYLKLRAEKKAKITSIIKKERGENGGG